MIRKISYEAVQQETFGSKRRKAGGKLTLKDGELEAVSGGVYEGQTLLCEDCLRPYKFTRGNFSTETLCNDCAIAKYLDRPDGGAVKTCVCKNCGMTYQTSAGSLATDKECSSCAVAKLFGSR